MSLFLITDIGSTTTKSYLCDEKGKVLSIAKVPTTVEKPFEDVSIGFFNAVRVIEKNNDITLFSDGKFSKNLHVYFTSSAGGGLQVTVVGLTDIYSAKIGEKAALGSGAIINNVISGGDNRNDEKKIDDLKNSSPDLILFAGGADSKFISVVCRMAKFIQKADIKNKFKKGNTPIIFSGNFYATQEIEKLLDKYPLFIEENICNSFKYQGENLQKRVQDIFQNHVMHDAPGYPKITKLTHNEILPTPIAVSRAMKLLGEEKNILLFDIGGATTDVYTLYNGKFFRSVSANIGMSYSIVNTFNECGIDNIKKHLTNDFSDDEILNYIGNKYINPTQLAKNKKEELIETSIAINAINKAIENHFELYKKEFNTILTQKSWLETLLKQNEDIKFDIIIGSGGIVSNNDAKHRKIIFSNIKLRHSQALFDKNFLFPHGGITSNQNNDFAIKLLKESLHEIDFDDNISQKIYKTNLFLNKSISENKPEIAITINSDVAKVLEKKEIKAGDVIFEISKKIYKKYYTSLPIDDDLKIVYQTSQKEFKEKDLILSLKKGKNEYRFYAPFNCELVELNKYQIVISELKKIDEITNYSFLNKYKDQKRNAILKELITKKYPNGLSHNKFYFNEIIVSAHQNSLYLSSPMTGKITNYDPNKLTISMKRLIEKIKIESFASGYIKEINDDVVKIKSVGTKLKCKFGFGKSQYAKIGENAMFIKNADDFNTFIEHNFQIAIAFNLPYKIFLTLSRKKGKSVIVINDFDDFIVSDLFDEIISKLNQIRFYCFTKTRMKSGVLRPFIYYETN